jgi:cathepsin H
LPSHAFEYIKAAGGLTTEDEYPYIAKDQACMLQGLKQYVGVVGGSYNISLSEEDLRNNLFMVGPVSVAFQVIAGFRDYKSGVYMDPACKNGPMDVNHAVLAVGYGTEGGQDYWIIKNSWGAAWGDNGYFKMARGINQCGIQNCNSYPMDVTDLDPQSKFFLQ